MDRLLNNELFVRLLSLVVAVLVYVVSQGAGGGSIERVVTGVPIGTVGLSAGLVATSITPTSVSVTVTGSATTIKAMDSASFGASVNLTGAQAGDKPYFVQVFIPPGLQYVATTPATVRVIVEQLTTLEQTPQVETSGTPAAGFASQGTPTVQPPLVVISGPASAVQQVVRVVATVPLDSASAPITTQVPPVPEDAAGKPVAAVTVTPALVSVTVPLAPSVPEKVVPVQIQTSGQPATGYAVAGVSASPADVTLLGPQSTLDGLSSASAAPVPVAGATGTVKTDVAIIQPPGVSAVSPTEVTVTVTISKTK